MDGSLDFRRRLAARLFVLALAGSAACSGSSTGGEGGQGQGSTADTSTGAGTFTSESCFAWPQAGSVTGTGGAGGVGGAGGAGGAGGVGGMGGAGGAGMTPPCPPMAEASMYIVTACGPVTSEGTFKMGQCCYNVECAGAAGRPFLVEGRPRAAEASSERKAWSDNASPRPSLEGLTAEERALLAEAWARDGLMEHASVASFGRFALELLAIGAPPELVTMAHEAALDEVRHAQLAFALASAYSGASLGPGAFPFGGSVAVSADLADIAARVVREGCVGETLASLIAAEQRAHAVDPAVAQVLAGIAEDEGRHAELAWRTVAWAVAQGGAVVQRAVAEAFAEALRAVPGIAVVAGGEGKLAAHGRPGEDVLRAAVERAVEDVIRPAAAALLNGRA